MTEDDDEALAPGHTASRRPAPRRGRRLIPYYRNARHWKFTNAQLLGFVGTAFAASVIVLAGTVYYAVNETTNNRAALSKVDDAVKKVDDARARGRTQRLESEQQIRAAQARTDLELARLACIQIRYIPQAKSEIERSLSPAQRELIKNCKAIAIGATPVPGSKPTDGASSPSSAPTSPGSRSPLADGPAPSSTLPPREGRRTTGPSASAPRRSAPAPSPPSTSSPILDLRPVLCGVIGIECPSGA